HSERSPQAKATNAPTPDSASRAVIRAARRGIPGCELGRIASAAALAGCALLLPGCSPAPSRLMALTPPAVNAESGDPALALEPTSGAGLVAGRAGAGASGGVWSARPHDRGAPGSARGAVSPPDEPLALRPESSPVLLCDDHRRVGLVWSTTVEIAGRAEPA